MIKLAHIDSEKKVVGIYHFDVVIERSDYIQVENSLCVNIGDVYNIDTGLFMAPPPPPALTPAELEQVKITEEKKWRDEELDYVDSKNYGESFPYFSEIEAYKQALRDYPMQPDFPYCESPKRPKTESGYEIIT
ncbi:phage tail assembly chaperone [Vibrio campbellii]|uniref:phage tail assembly chaperone n=1 Tax=Vibrio campbellii TaxID=680 RepID=UPI00210D1832|nr:phage tail assembly chaperone [Vibrio campbellii]UTZ44609.1 hypothetical protein HB764_25455 [Vibrio campbellii]